jgi:MFS/sugar transport protein
MTDRETLSATRLIVLSLPSLAFAGYDLSRRVYLAPYLSGELALQIGTVGWLVVLANFASIPAELLAGSMGDQGVSRFGRRRLWMMLGTALILIGTAMLLARGSAASIAAIVLALMVLVIGWAFCNVTHGAWALEAARESRIRGRIFGTRTLFGILGGIGFSVIGALPGGAQSSPFAAIMIPVAFGALLLHAALILLVPDQRPAPGRWRFAVLLDPLRLLFANRGNRRLAALFALNGMHAAITTTGYFYLVDDGLGLPGWAPTDDLRCDRHPGRNPDRRRSARDHAVEAGALGQSCPGASAPSAAAPRADRAPAMDGAVRAGFRDRFHGVADVAGSASGCGGCTVGQARCGTLCGVSPSLQSLRRDRFGAVVRRISRMGL